MRLRLEHPARVSSATRSAALVRLPARNEARLPSRNGLCGVHETLPWDEAERAKRDGLAMLREMRVPPRPNAARS